jgi:hypothetical protein
LPSAYFELALNLHSCRVQNDAAINAVSSMSEPTRNWIIVDAYCRESVMGASGETILARSFFPFDGLPVRIRIAVGVLCRFRMKLEAKFFVSARMKTLKSADRDHAANVLRSAEGLAIRVRQPVSQDRQKLLLKNASYLVAWTDRH